MSVWAEIIGPEHVFVTEIEQVEPAVVEDAAWESEPMNVEFGPPPVDGCLAPQGRIAWSAVISELNLSLTDIILEVVGPNRNAKPKAVLDHLDIRLNGIGALTVHKVASRMQQLRIHGVIPRAD